jgi:peptidyl-prolyl cis-trans isomerase C
MNVGRIMVSFSSCRVRFCLAASAIHFLHTLVIAGRSSTEAMQQNDLETLRLQAKPWYMKNISFGDNYVQIPISPATLIISFLTVFYMIYYYYSTQCYCIASHILIKDVGKETKLKLEQWKDKIGSNSQLFAKYASDHSECPSGKHNGGHLGKFYMYDMAPNFNAACFDKRSQLQTAIGPIQTQFGYHLIFIHERQIPK